VLAGDISSQPQQLLAFLESVETRFAHVVYVPGNHEYYGHNFDDWNREARILGKLKRTTAAINRVKVFGIDGVSFLACTLWGDGGATEQARRDVERGLADFHVIERGFGRFLVEDMQSINMVQRDELNRMLKMVPGPVVVVTHHLPSHTLCHPRFGDRINGGFASNCDAFMEGDHAPAVWVHGHTHDTIDRVIGKTRVVCNPAGYQAEWGKPFNTYFAAPMFIDVAPTPSGAPSDAGNTGD
jgi:hypothetical protein